MKVLILDNHDSFTYNLVQITEEILGTSVAVFKNNEIAIEEIALYDKIILSPGPGIPSEAGILLETIQHYAPSKAILGVCLGQQAIAVAFGGSLINLPEIYHGISTNIWIKYSQSLLFKDLPYPFHAGRYHSWAVDEPSFPEELKITAVDEKGIIMAIQHQSYDLHGVQFHPESILTPHGGSILKNFLRK